MTHPWPIFIFVRFESAVYVFILHHIVIAEIHKRLKRSTDQRLHNLCPIVLGSLNILAMVIGSAALINIIYSSFFHLTKPGCSFFC
ncbi:hypothetical protein VCR3J2_260019 [Vibrio coralliirubri]|nr:hypothetical protein VCR3J2_260019 [Vibrio coralliirubri]